MSTSIATKTTVKKVVCSRCTIEEFLLEEDTNAVTNWTCKKCKVTTEQATTSTHQQSTYLNIEKSLMAAMNGCFEVVEKRFDIVMSSFQCLSGEFDGLVKEMVVLKTMNADTKKGLEDVQQQNGEMVKIINQLTARLNQLEQAASSNTIEIRGIPPPPLSTMKEDIRNILQILATQIGAPSVADSVEYCYRVPAITSGVGDRGQRGSFIVVRLKNHLAKVAWLTARKNLRGVTQLSDATVSGSNNSCTLGTAGLRIRDIRIHEQLTTNNKRLLNLTRVAAREMNYQHVWVRNGKIFVTHDSERFTRVIRITDEDDLREKMGFEIATCKLGKETLV
jgi:hypothetical protein